MYDLTVRWSEILKARWWRADFLPEFLEEDPFPCLFLSLEPLLSLAGRLHPPSSKPAAEHLQSSQIFASVHVTFTNICFPPPPPSHEDPGDCIALNWIIQLVSPSQGPKPISPVKSLLPSKVINLQAQDNGRSVHWRSRHGSAETNLTRGVPVVAQ